MTLPASDRVARIPFCSLTELQEHRRVTKWMDELRDEVTALLLDEDIIVRSSVCVHMGGEFDVDWERRRLCCRWHAWEYDIASGECVTVSLPGRRLPPYAHVVEGGTVYLVVPDHARG